MSNKPLVVYGRMKTAPANEWYHYTIPQHTIGLICTSSLTAYIYLINDQCIVVDISGDPDGDLKGDETQAQTNSEAIDDYENGR